MQMKFHSKIMSVVDMWNIVNICALDKYPGIYLFVSNSMENYKKTNKQTNKQTFQLILPMHFHSMPSFK